MRTWRTGKGRMFSAERLIADCRAALAADKSHKHVCEVVRRAVSQPAAVLRGLGEPKRAGLHELYRSEEDARRDGVGLGPQF